MNSKIDFNAELAIDISYAKATWRTEQCSLPSVGMVAPKQVPLVTSESWRWAVDHLPKWIDESIATSSFGEAVQAEVAKSEKKESESSRLRQGLLACISGSVSDSRLGALTSKYLLDFTALESELTKKNKVNEGRTSQLNPLPHNKNKMELSENKTPKF